MDKRCPSCSTITDECEFIGRLCCVCYNIHTYKGSVVQCEREAERTYFARATERPAPVMVPRQRPRRQTLADVRRELEALMDKPNRTPADNARLTELGRKLDRGY